MNEIKSVPPAGLIVKDARHVETDTALICYRRYRERQLVKLASKIQRKKAHVKSTIKALKQYKFNIAKDLEKRQLELMERKNDVDLVMLDYKNECRQLNEEDSKDLHEFYIWAKEEIIRCSESAMERAPIEDNRDIRKAIEVIIKNC